MAKRKKGMNGAESSESRLPPRGSGVNDNSMTMDKDNMINIQLDNGRHTTVTIVDEGQQQTKNKKVVEATEKGLRL
ncbi:hypothetical protein V6N13_046973 [Hibiscus sabdariffa]|uniref:Uncharacterized protein n=1 Tax=Hibiscus sabdariffa TaxID=183260 RepID=A0ABR2CA28_9ROSI